MGQFLKGTPRETGLGAGGGNWNGDGDGKENGEWEGSGWTPVNQRAGGAGAGAGMGGNVDGNVLGGAVQMLDPQLAMERTRDRPRNGQ